MEIQQLKGFLAVAKFGSFSKAAEKTFRSQPAITLQIQALEKELNAKLFDRLGHKKIKLTGEGKALTELAGPLLEEISTLSARFNEIRGKGQKTPLKIATHSSVMIYLLPRIIETFKKRFPENELSVVNRGRQEIIEMVKNGEVDMGISSLNRIPAGLEYQTIARFNRVLITPRNHPLSRIKSIKLKDVAAYPLLIPPLGTNTRSIIDKVFASAELEYKIAMEIVGRDATKNYVGMGLGISIINEYSLTPEDKKNLFIADLSAYFGKAERGIITKKNKYLSTSAKEFIKLTLSSKSQ